MILAIMCILLIAFLFSWYGRRTPAITVFIVSFVLAIYWFWDNVTVHIGLSL